MCARLQVMMSVEEPSIVVLNRVSGIRSLNVQIISKSPELRSDYPLNLSISVSGGKETKQDSPSNGE